MNHADATAMAIHGHTFRGVVPSIADLPETGEVGHCFHVGEEGHYVWTTQNVWSLVAALDQTIHSVFGIERYLLNFEGVQVLLRVPLQQPIYGAYPYEYPVQDSELVSVLVQRLQTTWPGIETAVLDGRSGWAHTPNMTMGQLRNSYLMSRSPE